MAQKTFNKPNNNSEHTEIQIYNTQTDFDPLFELYIRSIQQLSEIINNEAAIYNLFKNEYLYYRSTLNKELDGFFEHGFDKEKNPGYFIRFLLKSDIAFVNEAQTCTINFLKEMPHELRPNYKLLLDVCLKHPNGYFFRIIHQSVVIESDDKNDEWLVFCLLDLIGKDVAYTPPMRQLINLKTRKNCLFKKQTNNSTISFTKREVEILKQIARGVESHDIAKKLFISNNTVCNHRQNILNKTNLSTMVQAVLYVQKTGMI